uniref:MyoD family inhibitor domain containing n=1 Tax=Sphenodon punctatus TaxID=8508 RepID=A0A8D0L2K5_SPHPU
MFALSGNNEKVGPGGEGEGGKCQLPGGGAQRACPSARGLERERGGGFRGAAAGGAAPDSGLNRREAIAAAGGGGGGGRREVEGAAERRCCCSSFGSLCKFPLPTEGGARRPQGGRAGAEGNAKGRVLVLSEGCELFITRCASWQMSQVREPLPPGPERPKQAAPAESSFLISFPREKCDQEIAAGGERDRTQPSNNQSIQAVIQDPSVWGNHTDGGDLIRTQPQPLLQPNTSALEKSEEETGKIQNGHAGLSNGNGIHNGLKHVATDNRKLSAPVPQKMHRKIQSSLSVNSDSSKKSKISSAYSQKPGSLPEDCCVHCILACLFCEFFTLCNIVLGQASCGVCTSEACCCCCGDEMGDDCNCPCDMDCGIMDACCESSDCLEICMECCGICFPS